MAKVFKEFTAEELEAAKEFGVKESKKSKEVLHLIKSTSGETSYFVEEGDCPFLRNWEEDMGVFEKGIFTES